MYGLGVLKGLSVTLKHFIDTYVDDFKYVYFKGADARKESFLRRQGPEGRGFFTVQYPEEKLTPPENFRFIPFLVTDYDVSKEDAAYNPQESLELGRCTCCGICAKVCPPQCIWMVRATDPTSGKPLSKSAEFYIDIDICMNCGYCAEFCPFDSIKMDHDYELADYERPNGHIHDIKRLTKSVSYYNAIRPTWNAKEVAARQAAEEEKRRKDEEKKRLAAEKATKTPAASVDKPKSAVLKKE